MTGTVRSRPLLLAAFGGLIYLAAVGLLSINEPPPEPVVITRTVVVEIPEEPAAPPPRATPTPEPTPEIAMASLALEAGEPRRYFDAVPLVPLLVRTWWPTDAWPDVISLVMCESGGDRLAVGDLDLMPRDGPSHGLGQVNVRAHARYAAMFDLFDAWQNLTAMHLIWQDAGDSFSPWKNCSTALGLR